MVHVIRKIVGKFVIPTVFIIGMLIFFYPIIGNWLSTKDHYTVISKHNEVLAEMSPEEKKKEKEKAKEYNDSLTEAAIPIVDPFSDDKGNHEEVTATGYYNVLDIGETMGTIEIPSINVELPIYHGISDDVLSQGIGHMSNSSFPIGGLGSHTALTGHRGLPSSKLFRDLDKVEVNDLFYIRTLDETLAYQVDDIQIVLPSETNWLEMKEDKDYVTLITCEPYMINTHRLLVRGERIPYDEPIINAAIAPIKKDKAQLIEYWLFIGGIVIIVMFLFMYLLRIWRRKGWKS